MINFFDTLLGLIVACSLKVVGLALIAWLGLKCLSYFRNYNANLHHRVWTGVLLGMLALPILQFAVPPVAVPLPIPAIAIANAVPAVDKVSVLEEQASGMQQTATVQPQPVINPIVSQATPEQLPVQQATSPLKVAAPSLLNWRALLAVLYVTVTALLLIRLVLGLGSANRLFRRATRIQIETDSKTPIYELLGNDIPFTLGLFRQSILLPEHWRDWSPEVLSSVLKHEQAHAERRDPLVVFLAELSCCFYWFHPVAWVTRKRLASLAEDVCDDSVMTQTGDRPGYAAHLLEVASQINGSTRLSGAHGIAMAKTTSQLERRIDSVLDPKRSLSRRLGWSGVVVALLSVVAWVAIAGIQDAEGKQGAEQKSSTAKAEIIDHSELTELEFDRAKKVKVVNAQGQPVEGAQITVTGGGYSSGTGVGWPFPKIPKPVAITSSDGIAELKFPTYFDINERVKPSGLYCEITHPDYCKFESALFSVSEKNIDVLERQTLHQGGKVLVAATVAGKPYSGTDLYLVSDAFSERLESLEGSPQVRLAAGVKMVRVVAFPPGKPTLFSKATLVEVEDGEELKLEVDLKLGVTVTGQLDDTVPRPVVDGTVSAFVTRVSKSPKSPDYNPMTSWTISATVETDGSFSLNDVPEGDLQVIAICKGYRAAPPEALPDFPVRTHFKEPTINHPQVFKVSTDQPITLKMTPTTSCRIKVTGPDSQPISDAHCYISPNVYWWSSGGGLYCGGPTDCSSRDYMEDPSFYQNFFRELYRKGRQTTYGAVTDENGLASVSNLPLGAREVLSVEHDRYQLPINKHTQQRYFVVELDKDKPTEITVQLQAIGDDFVGDAYQQEEDRLIASEVEQYETEIPKAVPTRIFKTKAKPTELAGVVIDEQGNPLEEVKAHMYPWVSRERFIKQTDKEGSFRFSNLERGESYVIEFSKPGYSPAYFLSQKAGTQDWTVVLTQGTWLEGQVLSSKGEPAANVQIRAIRGPFQNSPGHTTDEIITETESDEQGKYRLHLESGEYEVLARQPGTGVIRTDKMKIASKEKRKLDLQLKKGVMFQATLKDSITGDPVEGIMLWNWWKPEVKGVSNKDGIIEIPDMFSGPFEFHLAKPSNLRSETAGDYARWWSRQAVHEHQREERPVGQLQRNFDSLEFELEGDTKKVSIYLEPLVKISGKVHDPDGEPVEGATVSLAKTGSGSSITGDTRYSFTTDQDGSFEMKVPASKKSQYNLIVQDGPYRKTRNWANGVGDPIRTQPGEVVKDVALNLTRPATVEGTVLDESGNPRAFVDVRAFSRDGLDNRYYVPETKSDIDGKYKLEHVRPGKHFILVDRNWVDPKQVPNGTAQSIELEEGDAKENIDFPVEPPLQ